MEFESEEPFLNALTYPPPSLHSLSTRSTTLPSPSPCAIICNYSERQAPPVPAVFSNFWFRRCCVPRSPDSRFARFLAFRVRGSVGGENKTRSASSIPDPSPYPLPLPTAHRQRRRRRLSSPGVLIPFLFVCILPRRFDFTLISACSFLFSLRPRFNLRFAYLAFCCNSAPIRLSGLSTYVGLDPTLALTQSIDCWITCCIFLRCECLTTKSAAGPFAGLRGSR